MKEVITIPTNKILPAGRTLGIEPNRLSEVSGFPDITGTTKVEREWEALLPTLLAPGKVSMLMKGNRDQAIELSSLSSGDGKILMYSGKADGNTHIRTLEPKQFREELMAVMATNIPGKDIARPMSLDALFVLAALSDFIKRQKAQIMLGLTQEPTPPTLSEIQSLLDKAENTMEARWWLTPFLYHIYGLRRKIVVSDAVTQLQTFELVAENEGNVYPTEAGFILLDQLTFRRGIVGFHSFYFEEGKPVQSTQVLLNTLDGIWLMECGENSVLSSLSASEAERLIEQALSPGEAVPKEGGHQAPVSPTLTIPVPTEGPVTVAVSDIWFCSCGQHNEGKFCIACGKPKEGAAQTKKKRFCQYCGSEAKSDAKFCVNCGQKIHESARLS